MNRFRQCAAAVASLALLGATRTSHAQLAPNHDWRTLATPHFRVTFPRELEPLGRRAAGEAERAYADLSKELRHPRGTIDLVLTDDADYSNGYATPSPSNRIVIFANPPVDAGALRFTDDWVRLVVTHELTHIFHLDRSRGVWRLGQYVFGRAPFLFPNAYAPSWLTEGLAVYYESKLTGSGRLVGTEHAMIARAAAAGGHFPRIDEVSLATPRFPGGNAAYAYGSLFIQYLAGRGGPRAVRDLVERSSVQLFPIILESPAKTAFGISFQRAWRDWRDSVVREASRDSLAEPLPGWRDLTPWGFEASYPRWESDSTLLYTGAGTRELYGAWRLYVNGKRERIGRRNSRAMNVPLRDGSVLFTQLDFVNPYVVRSDLYVERDGHEHRLTRGARLMMADARADGEIVAVQTLPGATQLVRVSRDGSRILPITTGSADLQWSEPRWSPDGARIAAVRWQRGGTTSIVVMDSTGGGQREYAAARAIQSTPAWDPDGAWLWFISDREGEARLYRLFPASGQLARASAPGAPLLEPSASPDGQRLSAARFEWDGYHIGVADAPRLSAVAPQLPPVDTSPASRAAVPPSPRATSPASRVAVTNYSAWRTVLPRYWMPLAEPGLGNGTRLGAFTSGNDVVGRHSWSAQLSVPTDNVGGLTGGFAWRNAVLGQPLLDLSAFQDWEIRSSIRARRPDSTFVRVGTLLRRTRNASLAATFRRPRIRTNASMSFGVGIERRAFATTPDTLITHLRPEVHADSTYPRLFVSGGWGNAYRTGYSISPENGIGVSGSVIQRWEHGTSGAATRTYLGTLAGYRALPLPGFANHVLALRTAGGFSDANATRALEIGGVSGSPISVVPGVVLGEGYRTFPVRGFAPAALFGTRAATASLEYRAPLVLAARGFRLLPLFLDRTSVTFFGDAGTAGCGRYIATACPAADSTGGTMRSIASVGAELGINAAVLSWDQPYRFRLGVAAPVKGRELTGANRLSWYLTAGLSF